MTTRDVVFLAVGLITAGAALMSVVSRHVVHAALWLVLALGSLAGCYLVLGNELVALVQLLVYVGAVVILMIFTIMMTKSPVDVNPGVQTSLAQRVFAAIAGAGMTALIAALVLPVVGGTWSPIEHSTESIAQALFGTWVWPFELLSVLLLIALIGAFAVSKAAGLTSPEVRRVKGESA